jgi:hypothetical protein
MCSLRIRGCEDEVDRGSDAHACICVVFPARSVLALPRNSGTLLSAAGRTATVRLCRLAVNQVQLLTSNTAWARQVEVGGLKHG